MPDPMTISNEELFPYVVASGRLPELRAWLTAHNINPSDVPHHSTVTIERGPDGADQIRYTVYVRDADGHLHLHPGTDGPPEEERTTPLTVSPPQDWPPDILDLRGARHHRCSAFLDDLTRD
jgi:hypothetical protein